MANKKPIRFDYAGFRHPHGQVTVVRSQGPDVVVRFVWGHEVTVKREELRRMR